MLRAIWKSLKASCHRRRPHVLYFFHIPKTCGTTTYAMLASRFPDGRSAPILPGELYLRRPARELDGYDFISGHLNFGRHLPALVSRPVKTFVLLREPRAQVLSLYKHVLQHPSHPYHEHANRHCPTLERLFDDPLMSSFVSNYQARWLGQLERAFGHEEVAAIRAADPYRAADIVRAAHLATVRNPSRLLPDALERLGECAVVGLSEHLGESLDLVARQEGWRLFAEIPRLNVSKDQRTPADLPPDILRRIDDLTELDQALYEQAKQAFEKVRRESARLAA